MRKLKLMKTLLVVATLIVGGGNVWADAKTLYSQDFNSETAVPTGWTQANGTLSLEVSDDNKWLRETTSGSGSRTAWYTGSAIKDAIGNCTSYTLEFDCLIKEGTNTTNYCQGVWVTGSDLTQSWGTPTGYAIGVKKGSNEKTYTIQANGASTAETVNLTSNTWYHYVCAYDHSTKKITFSILSQDKSSTIYAAKEFDYDYSVVNKGVFQSIHFQSGRGSGYTELDNILLTTTYEVAYSAAKAPYDTKVASLDAAGQAYWATNVTSAASVTNEASYNTAVAALPTTYMAAVKAQTTEGSDMSDLLKTAVEAASWTNATGTYNSVAAERYNGDTPYATGKILYQTVSGLHAGYYKVKFYGVANVARTLTEEYYGSGIAQMYANSETQDVDVIYQSSCSPISDTYLREFDVYLSEDNSNIEFGIKNIKAGGQWYVAQALSLTYLGSSVYDYTINYKFNDATINTVNGTAAFGETINATSPITISDTKYYATSPTSMVIGEGENVLNVTLRKAETWSFTVRGVNSTAGVINDNLASGSVTEGEVGPIVFFPRYILKGTTLYCSKTGATYYNATVTPDKDDYVYDINYNETPVNNVAFYTEAEDVTEVTLGENGDRASMGKMGYTGSADTYKDVTTLAPGKYILYSRGHNANSVDRNFNFKVGSDVVYSGSIANGTNKDSNSSEFTVSAPSVLSFASEGSKNSGFDYFYLVKTAEAATITSAGYATFASAYDLDFTTPISGLTAYKAASATSSAITLEEVDSKVKAGDGLVIKGTAGTYTIPVTTGASTIYTNKENINMWGNIGTADETVNEAGSGTNFVLALQSGNVVFAPIKGTSATLKPGQAALWADAVSAARALNVVFADETQGISAVETAKAQDGQTYNLAGQRVKNAVKGLYIVNGKKAIMK